MSKATSLTTTETTANSIPSVPSHFTTMTIYMMMMITWLMIESGLSLSLVATRKGAFPNRSPFLSRIIFT